MIYTMSEKDRKGERKKEPEKKRAKEDLNDFITLRIVITREQKAHKINHKFHSNAYNAAFNSIDCLFALWRLFAICHSIFPDVNLFHFEMGHFYDFSSANFITWIGLKELKHWPKINTHNGLVRRNNWKILTITQKESSHNREAVAADIYGEMAKERKKEERERGRETKIVNLK